MIDASRGTAIQLLRCGKTFPDGTRALEPLSLEVRSGETIVLLGPSGCGKTTTLRIVAGLEEPDPGGRVLFDSEDVTELPIERRNVGMVFQSYALFPNLDVAGNITYGLKVRKVPAEERRRRCDEMLEMMHITELRERRIDQLSGGQRQRVALARAIIVRPRVLLLDEPLTALDALLRQRLRVEIDRMLRRLGITAIYVTHDQAEAMTLGDRIVVMSRGCIEQVATPREVYFHPANRFVADFIGSTNRLRGVARAGVLETPAGRLPLAEPWEGPVEVFFRPEDAAIVSPDRGDLRGRVSASFFLGDRTRVLVECGADDSLVVETADRREFHIGEDIGLRVPGELLLRLKD